MSQSSGSINLAASTKMVQLKYVFKTVKRKWDEVCNISSRKCRIFGTSSHQPPENPF